MDHDLRALDVDQYDHLEQVARGVRTDEEPSIGILSRVVDRKCISIAWAMSSSATPCLRAAS